MGNYIRILRRSWFIILSLAVVGGIAATATARLEASEYTASAQMYVGVRSGATASTNELTQGAAFARQAVVSYVVAATSDQVLDRVLADIGDSVTKASLKRDLVVASPSGTVVLNITASSASADQAAEIANSVATNLATVVTTELDTPAAGTTSTIELTTVKTATAPTQAENPYTKYYPILGVLIGILLGIGVAATRDRVDRRVRTSRELDWILDKPILGTVHNVKRLERTLMLSAPEFEGDLATSFQRLRSNVQFADVDGGSRCFAVVSPSGGEGTTSTAAILAMSLKATGASVALVDADLRGKTLSSYLGADEKIGLSDVLVGRTTLSDSMTDYGDSGLFLLPAGSVAQNSSELIASRAMESVLADVAATFDYVIIDTPPLLDSPDGAVLSALASGCLVVVAAAETTRPEIEDASRHLADVHSRIIGFVVTKARARGANAWVDDLRPSRTVGTPAAGAPARH